jgi:hypothetical protein
MLNLDNMSIDELWKFYAAYIQHPRLTAKKYNLTVKDIRLYAAYASNLATAKKLRRDGLINEAMKYERICDKIYTRITIKKW